LVTAAGVTVDGTTLRAAEEHADARRIDALDLVPGDLPVEPLLDLIWLVNPKTFRDTSLAAGRGAGHATLVRSSVLDRIDVDRTHDLDPVEYVELMVALKRAAPTSTDLVVAPRLRAVEPQAGWRHPRLRRLYGPAMPLFAVGPALYAAVLGAGPRLGRRWGLAALAAFAAQPYIATAGRPVRPRNLNVRSALGRVANRVTTAARGLTAPVPGAAGRRAEAAAAGERALRGEYATLMAGPDAFFEPARSTCPWCGSGDVQQLMVIPDLMQGKPGRFRLDECHGCRHVFQNPRLSLAGLDFYYRDYYDGLQGEQADLVFSTGRMSYLGRARLLQERATPKHWLDVGAGHGHFCLVAKEVWPETRFDGLDMGESIVEAERRGWIEQAYRGLLTALANDLSGAYDVVSMNHYLEHTRDPTAELDAAHAVLEEGGHLLIEVPDPECRLARPLGWLWASWSQPQHLHLMPLDNLVVALEERGFSVVAVERGPAHMHFDVVFGLWLLVNRIAPAGARPWEPEATLIRRFLRGATFTAFAPLLIGGLFADAALAPLMRGVPGLSNTYRVLARKDRGE
jgi:SAM-dependent methyltransferase